MRFIGNIEAKADSKGRVFFPATFRKQLGEECTEGLVMRKDVFQPCLVIYPSKVWNGEMDALRARLSRWNAAEQQLFRQFVSDVEIVSLDTNGRLLIPRRYLALAGIEREVKFIGMGDTIEVWNASMASKPFLEPEVFGQKLQEVMEPTKENNEE